MIRYFFFVFSSDIAANRATFAITDTKLYVPFVTLSAKSFWSASEIDLRTYDNIRKIATTPGDDFTTGCLLNYPYFKEYYKTIAIALTKQHLMLIRKQYNRLILLEIHISTK